MRKLFVAATFSLLIFNLGCSTENANRATNANQPANVNANSREAAGDTYPDAWITTKVKLALLADNRISGFATDVDTRDGTVTLSGKVNENENKSAAEEVTKKIEGVKSVNNQIQVVPDAKRDQVNATDDKIEDAIGKAVEADTTLNELSLTADSNNGVVTVNGSVDTNEQLLKYAQAVRKVPGVKSVVTTPVTIRNPKS